MYHYLPVFCLNAASLIYLFGGCSVGGCVLLVNLENTLSSVGRSRTRRDRVGEEGGVASDEVASL